MTAEQYRADMDRQKDRVAFDMKELIAAIEELLKSTASYTGAEIEAARARLTEQLEIAKDDALRWKSLAREKVRHASECTDEYAHEHPWRLVGVAAAAGVIVGHCLLGGGRR
jgi:ElaB/YqjD/DUF883 family membrane-anchored ribosome-binding protein